MKNEIDCGKCGGISIFKKNLKFNGYEINGWVCKKCKETYYEPEQTQSILLLNKLKKEEPSVKLGKIKSNLILRIPKDVEKALGLEKGEQVKLKIDKRMVTIIPS